MKLALISSLLLALPLSSHAEEKKPKIWKFSSETTYVNTSGNTDTETLGSKNNLDFDWKKTALRFRANAMESKENNIQSAENYLASQKFEWKFQPKNFFYQLLSWDKDRFAGIDSREALGLGFGRALLATKRNKLTGEGGGQYTLEDRAEDDASEFSSARLFADYRFVISDTSHFNQTVEYLKDFSATEAYRLNALTAVTAKMTTHLAMKISYEIKYNNNPPIGIRKTDTYTNLALVIDF